MRRNPDQVFTPVYVPRFEYLGGERLVMAGAARAATLPEGAEYFEITAEGGVINFSINTLNASAASSGYIAQNNIYRSPRPLFNLQQLSVFGAGGTFAHLLYYREIPG